MRRSRAWLVTAVLLGACGPAAPEHELAAERFGATARSGRIEPGLDADLVVLEGDPERDVRALARVRLSLRRGVLLYASDDAR